MSDPIPQPPAEESGGSKRRMYTDEFKRDVVWLITGHDYSIRGAAKAVGVYGQTVRNWFHNLASKPEPIGEDASVDDLKAEYVPPSSLDRRSASSILTKPAKAHTARSASSSQSLRRPLANSSDNSAGPARLSAESRTTANIRNF